MANIAFTSGMNHRNGVVKADRIMVENSETGAAEWVTLQEVENLIVGSVPAVQVSGITLNSNEYILSAVGNTFQLQATVIPSNATNQAVTWSSTNAQAVSVSASGLITRLQDSLEPVLVSATTVEGGHVASCVIPANKSVSVSTAPTNVVFDSTGKTVEGVNYQDVYVNITGTENKEFNILNAPSWISVTKYESYFRIMCEATTASREIHIVVQSAQRESSTAILTVSQTATQYVAVVESLSAYSILGVPSHGQQFRIYGNVDGTSNRMLATGSLPEWITAAPGSDGTGYGQGYIDFTVLENQTDQERSATVNIYPQGFTSNGKQLSITQYEGSGQFVEVEGIDLGTELYQFSNADVGSSAYLPAYVNPSYATDKSITYSIVQKEVSYDGINYSPLTPSWFQTDQQGNVTIVSNVNGLGGLKVVHTRADGRKVINGLVLSLNNPGLQGHETDSPLYYGMSQDELEINNAAQMTKWIRFEHRYSANYTILNSPIDSIDTSDYPWLQIIFYENTGFRFQVQQNNTGSDRTAYIKLFYQTPGHARVYVKKFKLTQKA